MSVADAVHWALEHVYHEDLANTAMHTAPVRFSPITFRLAEAYRELVPDSVSITCVHVLGDNKGAYQEDRGR